VPDLELVADLARAVALQVHVPFFRTGLEGEEQSPGKLVSRVDREAELLFTEGLRGLTPGVPVVGEAASADRSLLAALRQEDAAWLLNPLDGTPQFFAGSPDHAVMVALVQAGPNVAALVHQSQYGRTYMASWAAVQGGTGAPGP